MKDVAYRIAPFDLATAREMIADLRGARLFDGYRGTPPADKEALAHTLVAVATMAAALAPASRSSTSTQCSSAQRARAWSLPTRCWS